MSITAKLEPLPYSDNLEDEEGQLYRNLEIKMQQMGYLVPYREELNWKENIQNIDLGDQHALLGLKKAAAKNDRVLLFYAKLLKGTVYQNIILHPNNEGIYLPFHFEKPFTLNIKGKKLWIGSSSRLSEELSWLKMSIEQENHSKEVISYWKNLRKAAEVSVENVSPIVIRKS
ncbi:hypothetical protein [Pseudalkalibacillus caeni]|uniref:Uncharacterized protein n=1 Tax=Exobacillus caeni TaxID=2574798 RepID=A0A5R9FA53_9BACL|nr:hypothetical protein [Pseudalkalibacillus caeni]TLS37444.1 hypothetical protein FCL54_09870 [Pseudalkalibacillus caeni]